MITGMPPPNICRARPHIALTPRLVSRYLRTPSPKFLSTRHYNQRCSSIPRILCTISRKSDRKLVHKLDNRRLFSSTPSSANTPPSLDKEALFALVDKLHEQQAELVQDLDQLNLADEFPEISAPENLLSTADIGSVVGYRSTQDLEAKVRLARQYFGESLPDGELNEEELAFYINLYGKPVPAQADVDTVDGLEEMPNRLFRDDGDGGLVELDISEDGVSKKGYQDAVSEDATLEEYIEHTNSHQAALEERARRVAEQLGGEVVGEELVEGDESSGPSRRHPLTAAGKFGTFPSTVHLPNDSMVEPVSEILSNVSNKHITDAARDTFGGPGLPTSTSTLKMSPRAPIPLRASHHHMSQMEANLFLSVLYPGVYASTLSALTEVRKRLGAQWLRDLLYKEGGPKILDAGGGGAGILAWRDIVKAEWSVMSPDHPADSPVPMGNPTVLAGSDALRHRASQLLENTTFIPRLPDYLHIRDPLPLNTGKTPPNRKYYDVIVAPHTVLPIEENHMRKDHVKNLWSLLNPSGGVLILLEKGRPRGFEAIAGAREMILDKLISSPGSTEYDELLESPSKDTTTKKEKGMIIAPCTNHKRCPMYPASGELLGRKDYCRFSQRYIRPPYLQRILDAKRRNHEDVEFSYLAVQRGVDQRETQGIVQNAESTNAAFAGPSEAALLEAETTTGNGNPTNPIPDTVNPLSMPRLILPALKRKGHVTMDLCTPEGKIERWTVPRSFSAKAYQDARKSEWGDLWALGAKSRSPRNLNVGITRRENSKRKYPYRERAVKRRDIPDSISEEEEELGREMDPGLEAEEDVDIPDFEKTMAKFDAQARRAKKKMGTTATTKPAWVKKMENRRDRKKAEKITRESFK